MKDLNWRDVPYFFAGGEFELKESDRNQKDGFCYKKLTPQYLQMINDGIDNINKHQLIARPIEDMSDEERFEFNSISDFDLEIDTGKELHYYPTPEPFIYLLSIGVYPLPNTEGVIFRNKEEM